MSAKVEGCVKVQAEFHQLVCDSAVEKLEIRVVPHLDGVTFNFSFPQKVNVEQRLYEQLAFEGLK